MGTENNIERYQEIARRVNLAFEFVRSLLKEEELKEFLDFIEQVDVLLPVTDPSTWDRHYKDIDQARGRVKLLLNIVRQEVKR